MQNRIKTLNREEMKAVNGGFLFLLLAACGDKENVKVSSGQCTDMSATGSDEVFNCPSSYKDGCIPMPTF